MCYLRIGIPRRLRSLRAAPWYFLFALELGSHVSSSVLLKWMLSAYPFVGARGVDGRCDGAGGGVESLRGIVHRDIPHKEVLVS